MAKKAKLWKGTILSKTVRVEQGYDMEQKVCTQAMYNRCPPNNRVDAIGNPMVVGQMCTERSAQPIWKVYKEVDGVFQPQKSYKTEAAAMKAAEKL